MRLFKTMIILTAVLDIAMFLQSPTSPLSARTPSEVIGLSADNTSAADITTAEAAPLGARF